MDRTGVLWTLVVFFGSTVAFGLIRNATLHQPLGVTIGLQAVALALMVGAIVVVVKWRQ